jgi:DNA-3-methyladenine glycosylase II
MERTINTFSRESFHQICDELAWRDKELATVMRNYGYPPMWTRSNSFESLVHIILEQQVSLASALAALNKLKEKIVEITPENVLALSDEELRACYFSRQKTVYVKHLAQVLADKKIDLNHLPLLPDEEIRKILNQLKGVGNWTIDVYLMFVLQRTDIFPVGDLAAVNAFKKLKGLPADTTKEQLIAIARNWGPYRTVATMLLWHYYLSLRTKS